MKKASRGFRELTDAFGKATHALSLIRFYPCPYGCKFGSSNCGALICSDWQIDACEKFARVGDVTTCRFEFPFGSEDCCHMHCSTVQVGECASFISGGDI